MSSRAIVATVLIVVLTGAELACSWFRKGETREPSDRNPALRPSGPPTSDTPIVIVGGSFIIGSFTEMTVPDKEHKGYVAAYTIKRIGIFTADDPFSIEKVQCGGSGFKVLVTYGDSSSTNTLTVASTDCRTVTLELDNEIWEKFNKDKSGDQAKVLSHSKNNVSIKKINLNGGRDIMCNVNCLIALSSKP